MASRQHRYPQICGKTELLLCTEDGHWKFKDFGDGPVNEILVVQSLSRWLSTSYQHFVDKWKELPTTYKSVWKVVHRQKNTRTFEIFPLTKRISFYIIETMFSLE